MYLAKALLPCSLSVTRRMNSFAKMYWKSSMTMTSLSVRCIAATMWALLSLTNTLPP
ncbi:hypothetical protein D3C87_2186950 [compost metagenome]